MNKVDPFLLALAVIAILILFLAGSALGALIFMLLWNWLMPYLFSLPEVSFWMAWGLLWLLSFIGAAFRTVVTSSE